VTPFVRGVGLVKTFPAAHGVFGRSTKTVHAVTDVSLEIERATTLGLVGESGCGKSTVGQMLLGLIRPTAGSAYLGDIDVTKLRGEPLRRLRARMQMIFQNPYGSLNPRLRVADSIALPLRLHRPEMTRAQRLAHVGELLALVGLRADQASRRPSEFSGGQRQRIVIARALAARPEFIFADEPVSALDVSVQAQIVNLLMDLQRERQLSILFVSHDLKVVQHVAHRVAVMYLGRIVEEAPARSLFAGARHPYTQALISAAPDPRPGQKRLRVILDGEVPSPLRPPGGCSFHPRCPLTKGLDAASRRRCQTEVPALRPLTNEHQRVACHFAS